MQACRTHLLIDFCKETKTKDQCPCTFLNDFPLKYGCIHREIVPPREAVAITRVAIAIVGRGGWGSLPYTVAMKIQWRRRQHCKWSRQQHVLLYVIKWQMIRFQALWKTKSFVKVCLKFKLPLWTKGLLIHLLPLWQLPLWHFPRWHNFPVYMKSSVLSHSLMIQSLWGK